MEFKDTFDRQVIETLAAFASSAGGRVLLGITDSGEVNRDRAWKVRNTALG